MSDTLKRLRENNYKILMLQTCRTPPGFSGKYDLPVLLFTRLIFNFQMIRNFRCFLQLNSNSLVGKDLVYSFQYLENKEDWILAADVTFDNT